MYSFPSDNFPKARLGLLRLQRDWALRPAPTWKVCTFGKLSSRKIPLGCCRLRKSLWESTYYLSSSPSLCLLSPSFLSTHPLFPVSSSLPFCSCLLIQSFLSPHPLFPVSSSYPYIILPVSSSPLSCLLKLIILFHHLLLSVHSFTYSYSLYPLSFFPVSTSLFPASTSAVPISLFTSFRHCSHSLSSDPALY